MASLLPMGRIPVVVSSVIWLGVYAAFARGASVPCTSVNGITITPATSASVGHVARNLVLLPLRRGCTFGQGQWACYTSSNVVSVHGTCCTSSNSV